jgi:hypothetical protein
MPSWYTPGIEHGVGAVAQNAFGVGFAAPEVVMGVLMIFLTAVALVRRFARV